jgi:hypothetical protein
MIDRNRAIARVLIARRWGATLRVAAKIAGIHLATLHRWQESDEQFRLALDAAGRFYRQHGVAQPQPRPRVPWRRDCPLCQGPVVVRATARNRRFWRCGRWPTCPWASWRPRAPQDCQQCGAACFWSHTRKSIRCSGCGMRSKGH